MTAERIKEIAERLRSMSRFAEDDYVYVGVTTRDYEYPVDLGVFGTRTMEVEIENDEYELDAANVLNKYPIGASEFYELAEELDEAAQKFGGDLDLALNRLKESGEGALVSAVRSVVDLFRTTGDAALDLDGLSIGALPPKPLPWPGAMRPGIDYTSEDFPFRYQPPPGYGWARENYDEGDRTAADAVRVPASTASAPGQMVMDNKGRVKWELRGDDDYADGFRWRVWHKTRDGVPRSRGMGASTQPRALDRDGTPIAPTTIEDAWSTTAVYEQAKTRLLEIRGEFEQAQAASGAVNEYGVTYDPLDVSVSAVTGYSLTSNLRLGDLVTGAYGRVVAVENRPGGDFELVTNDNGRIRRDVRSDFDWQIYPIDGVNREAQPTALTVTQPTILKYGYDPATVATGDRLQDVPTTELRVGDLVDPGDFGRALTATRDPNNGNQVLVTFQRKDGSFHERRMNLQSTWTLLPVAGGLRRELLPTLVSLMEEQPGAPQQVDYDPLTIPVREDEEILVSTSELRLGDDVIGSRWGRVTKVNSDFSFEMNRDGTINTYDAGGDVSWSIHPIDVPDRDEVPTAFSLGSAPAEIAF